MTRGSRLLWEIVKYALGKPSIVGLGPTLVYCFWHSEPSIRNHDLQLTFAPASYKEGVQSEIDTEPDLPVQPGNNALNRLVIFTLGLLIPMTGRLFSLITWMQKKTGGLCWLA